MACGAVPDFCRLDASEPTEKLIDCIKEHGCVIIKGLASAGVLSKIEKEVRPYLEVDKPWKGANWPPETRRCTRLVQRSETFRNELFAHPLVAKLVSTFVDKTTHNYYGEQRYVHTSRAHISTSLTMEIGPGGAAQRIHRDDKNFHGTHTDRTKTGFEFGQEAEMGFLIAGVDVTEENGATLVIPGSHLWDDERVPKLEETFAATMQAGDAVAFLGSLYHAGGHNKTTHDKRTVHSVFYCRGYYRPEENHYLFLPKEEILSWPKVQQELMGYFMSSPVNGNIDFRHPIDYLMGDDAKDFIGDMDPIQGADKGCELKKTMGT